MTIDDVLVLLSLHATADGFDAKAILNYVEPEFSAGFTTALTRGLRYGWVTTARYKMVSSAEIPHDFPKATGTLLSQLANLGYFSFDIVADHNLETRETIRLWAYAEPWVLIEQDEDLLLMDVRYYRDFLQISAETDCPKSAYMLSIVEHSIRDRAHNVIGTPKYAAYADSLHAFIAPARQAGATKIADYIERLIEYAGWRKWDKRTARQFGCDLTRCTAPPETDIIVSQDGDGWLITTGGSPYSVKQLRIDRRSSNISTVT